MVEKFDPKQAPLPTTIDAQLITDDRAWFENKLISLQQELRNLSNESSNLQRAQIELEIAETMIGLNRLDEAWDTARPLVELFLDDRKYELTVRACRVLYQADKDESISALGQGCWLAVTYPIDPSLTIEMLHNIVDETPDHSDGAAVAAMVAHYIAEKRGAEEQQNLSFLTSQIIAKVAKRHRKIEDEEMIQIWIEMLELNDTDKLFPRLAQMLDVIVDNQWWFDRETLRSQLPVN